MSRGVWVDDSLELRFRNQEDLHEFIDLFEEDWINWPMNRGFDLVTRLLVLVGWTKFYVRKY